MELCNDVENGESGRQVAVGTGQFDDLKCG